MEHREEKPNIFVVMVLLVLALGGIFYAFKDKSDKEVVEGTVVEVISEDTITLDLGTARKATREQELLVRTKSGDVSARNDFSPVVPGTKLFLGAATTEEGLFRVVEISRIREISILAIFFVLLVFVTSGRKGVYSLVGLLWSFAVIFVLLIPGILSGWNPIGVGIASAAAILAPALYLSYGLTKKSFAAFAGIIIALVFTGILANTAVSATRFTGLTEEAMYLNIEAANSINLIGLLIAGIIIAAVGVLDDVAAVQASTVFSLVSLDPSLRGWRLFRKAMAVGKDHIAAVVNTLVLAYAGASLPLLLLFSIRALPPGYFVSIEMVAEEIIRTLVASSGLLLAVPFSTAIATVMASRSLEKAKL